MANPESTVTTAIGTVRWFQLASALHRKDPELDTACWADTVSKDLRTITAGGAVSQHKPVADLADAISVLREFSSVLSSSK